MENLKRQWLLCILVGGLLGLAVCMLIGFVTQPGALSGAAPSYDIRDFAFYFGSGVPEGLGTALSLLLWLLFGAELGTATLPFPDGGRGLAARSLVHFAATAATVSAWVMLNFGAVQLPFFLIALTLVYLIVWLGRWVGWYTEVAAIREKLGLDPGPSPLHWRESLPYVGFAAFLCLALPLALRLLDDPTPLLSVLYGWLLLPVGGFMSGLSLGRRHGLCPIYPAACVVFILIFIPLARLFTNISDVELIPIALLSTLAGNLAGAARRKLKKGAAVHEKTDPDL